MLNFLNEILAQESIWYLTEPVCDEIECEDDKLSQYIRQLRKVIRKQKKILQKLFLKIKEYQKGVLSNNVATQTDERTITVPTEQTDVSSSWKTETSSVEEIVKGVAEDAMKQTGFVYEATSGLYYDYNSGYYYSAEHGLYYDGNSGTYYYYDKENNTFIFHSQVAVSQIPTVDTAVNADLEICSKKRIDNDNTDGIQTSRKLKKKKYGCDIEEGECSEDSNEPSDTNSDGDVDNDNTSNFNSNSDDVRKRCVFSNEPEFDETSRAWPPCMRIIVKETTVRNLQVGSLFVITCAGGTLGREGDHSLLIPDLNVSKYHAEFKFDTVDESNEIGNYTLTDLGSRNGTFVDGNRLSTALQESAPYPIPHDCLVRVGSTTLLCHVHVGRETCMECEPGVLIPAKDEKRNAYVPLENLTEKRRKQLKKLKQKFGLSSVNEQASAAGGKYKDRAEIRRQTVGSSGEGFKTEVASVSEPIRNTNKGFQLLSKMGWSEGKSLGSTSEDGIKEPVWFNCTMSTWKILLGFRNVDGKGSTMLIHYNKILAQQRAAKVGLGFDKPVETELPEMVKKKQELWKKVQDRYRNLE